MINSKEDSNLIDYEKYLRCPDCKKSGLYCSKHKAEVEKILSEGSATNKPV